MTTEPSGSADAFGNSSASTHMQHESGPHPINFVLLEGEQIEFVERRKMSSMLSVLATVILLVVSIVIVLCAILTILLIHDWAIVCAIIGGLVGALFWALVRFTKRFTSVDYSVATSLRLISITRKGVIWRRYDIAFIPLVQIRHITKIDGGGLRVWPVAEPRFLDLYFEASFADQKSAKRALFRLIGAAKINTTAQANRSSESAERPVHHLVSLPKMHRQFLEGALLNQPLGSICWIHREGRMQIIGRSARFVFSLSVTLWPGLLLPISFLMGKAVLPTVLSSFGLVCALFMLWSLLSALQRGVVNPHVSALTTDHFIQSSGAATSCSSPLTLDRKHILRCFPIHIGQWSPNDNTAASLDVRAVDVWFRGRDPKEDSLISKYNLDADENREQAMSWIFGHNIQDISKLNALLWHVFVAEWMRGIHEGKENCKGQMSSKDYLDV